MDMQGRETANTLFGEQQAVDGWIQIFLLYHWNHRSTNHLDHD